MHIVYIGKNSVYYFSRLVSVNISAIDLLESLDFETALWPIYLFIITPKGVQTYSYTNSNIHSYAEVKKT